MERDLTAPSPPPIASRSDLDTPSTPFWTRRRFLAAVFVPPPFVYLGGRLLEGTEEVLFDRTWHGIYGVVSGVLVALWLLSAFSAFRNPWRALTWVGSGFGLGVASMSAAWTDWTAFREVARTQTLDGTTYILIDRSVMQGKTCAIARVRGSALGRMRIEVLASSGYDSPKSVALLMRSASAPRADGWQIHVADDGLIAGFLQDMACVVAFDATTSERYGRDYGPGIETLPPFRLLGAHGLPLEADVRELESLAARFAISAPGERTFMPFAVTEPALREALDASNEHVRTAATRVIRAGGASLYPAAIERIR